MAGCWLAASMRSCPTCVVCGVADRKKPGCGTASFTIGQRRPRTLRDGKEPGWISSDQSEPVAWQSVTTEPAPKANTTELPVCDRRACTYREENEIWAVTADIGKHSRLT